MLNNYAIGILIAIGLAVLFGNGSVYVFNRLPLEWFDDRDEKARERKSLNGAPWKYIFTGLFLVVGIYLTLTSSVKFEIATMTMLFVVLEMAIADQNYRIVPNQLMFLLALSAIGFIGYNDQWWEAALGCGFGLALGIAELGLGLLIYKKAALGGADIKFLACMGLVAGRRGIIAIFIIMTLLFAAQSAYMLATKRIKRDQGLPLMPAAFVATLIYFVFLYNTIDILTL